MFASLGGSPGFSPGVTTFGSGKTIPLLYSLEGEREADAERGESDSQEGNGTDGHGEVPN